MPDIEGLDQTIEDAFDPADLVYDPTVMWRRPQRRQMAPRDGLRETDVGQSLSHDDQLSDPATPTCC